MSERDTGREAEQEISREAELSSAQIQEIQAIAAGLFEDRLAEESRSAESQTDSSSRVDFRLPENLHLHPDYSEATTDGRFALLCEAIGLLGYAITQIEGREDSGRTIGFISSYGMPYSIITDCPVEFETRHLFRIAFTHESYVELLDFIVPFTGIEREEFLIEIAEIGQFFTSDTIVLPTNTMLDFEMQIPGNDP
jgi:hypothetical protein